MAGRRHTVTAAMVRRASAAQEAAALVRDSVALTRDRLFHGDDDA